MSEDIVNISNKKMFFAQKFMKGNKASEKDGVIIEMMMEANDVCK